MTKLTVVSASTPGRLMAQLLDSAGGDDGGEAGHCIVALRAHTERELREGLLRRSACAAYLGPRVMGVEALFRHFQDPAQGPALSRSQFRQFVAARITELHRESEGTRFRRECREDGEPLPGFLEEATRLLLELETFRLDPDEVERRLLVDARHAATSTRAEDVAHLHRRVWERMLAQGLTGPLGRKMDAAARAAHLPLPEGMRTIHVVGLDGSGLTDVAVMLVEALARSPHVSEVLAYMVLPDDLDAAGWSTHGNRALMDTWSAAGVARRVAPDEALGDTGRPPALAAMTRDPFDLRSPPVAVSGGVSMVRVPDPAREAEWIARQVKRCILEGVDPGEIAVIARDMPSRGAELVRYLELLGVPVVASWEQPVSEAPAVRFMTALLAALAGDWSIGTLEHLARATYMDLGLAHSVIRALSASEAGPRTPTWWVSQATLLAAAGPGEPGDLAARTLDGLRSLADRHIRYAGSGTRTPGAWVAGSLAVLDAIRLETLVHGAATGLPLADRARVVRRDLDGAGAYVDALRGWAMGHEHAGTAEDPVPADRWVEELHCIAEETTIRSSTWAADAVQIVDPIRAGLREWETVFVAGLVEGVFPAPSIRESGALSDEERVALSLPTAAQRVARERLLFHLSCAAARRELILVSPTADDRGRALIPSPFLASLPLRIAGLESATVPATEIGPDSADALLCPQDEELFAAQRARTGLSAALQGDSLVARWAGTPAGRQVLARWTTEQARSTRDASQAGPFTGDVGTEALSADILSEEARFSPTSLKAFAACGFRYMATRILGVPDAGDDHSEERRHFGTLSHRILEALYGRLVAEGRLPPRGPADLRAAHNRAAEVVEEVLPSEAVRMGIEIDLVEREALLAIVRRFVERDLSARLEAAMPGATALRTRPAHLEHVLDVPLTAEGTAFRLSGRVDLVETIDDPRVPAPWQGALVLSDYKSSPRKTDPGHGRYRSGEDLQLPLYAAGLEAAGHRVAGWREVRIASPEDPKPVMAIEAKGGPGEPIEVRPDPAGAETLTMARDQAVARAAGIVRAIRKGDFSPRPGPECRNCSLGGICRASAAGGSRFGGGGRAPLPLLVASTTETEQ